MRLLLHPETAPCIDSVLHVQIISSSTLSYTWSSEASASCTGYRRDVTDALEPFKVLQDLSFPEQRLDIMHLSGTHVLSQTVLDMVANRTGEQRLVPSHPEWAKGCAWQSYLLKILRTNDTFLGQHQNIMHVSGGFVQDQPISDVLTIE